jgi:hypothetical protein
MFSVNSCFQKFGTAVLSAVKQMLSYSQELIDKVVFENIAAPHHRVLYRVLSRTNGSFCALQIC